MNKALLPAGFHDLLAPEAGEYMKIISKLLIQFERFGYTRVNPPAIEFEDSLFAGAGKALESDTFRLMDPASHNMMGVRADITTQVARIATTRLQNSPVPLRLSYSGDVFRVKGEGLHAERQFTQTGMELIGVDNIYADAEVVNVAVNALKKAGVTGLCIDFTLPGLVRSIVAEMKLSKEDDRKLLDSLAKKDMTQIEKFAGNKAGLFLKMAESGINVADLKKLDLPDAAKDMCARLEKVIGLVKADHTDIDISVDPIESVKFTYHSVIGFSVFSRHAKSELGRGGRYVINSGGNKTDAVGFTVYVNELFRILPKSKPKKRVFVAIGTAAEDIEKLQADGAITVMAVDKDADNKKEAERLGCKAVFAKGKLTNL